MTTVVVWRHGRTSWNQERRFQGQVDVPLDEVGLGQVEQAAARLAQLRPDVILSSDLRRCATGAKLLSTSAHTEFHMDERLRELSYGDWEGLTHAEVESRWPSGYRAWLSGHEPDGLGIESQDHLRSRVAEVLTEYLFLQSHDRVVVVTHAATAMSIISGLLNRHDIRDVVGPLDNGCFSVLSSDSGPWTLNRHNA